MPPVSLDEVRAVARHIIELGDLAGNARATHDNNADRIEALVAGAAAILPTSNGALDEAQWSALPPAEQAQRFAALVRFEDSLRILMGTDGPASPSSIMFRDYVSNTWVVLIALFAFLGTAGMLLLIHQNWTIATSGIQNHHKGVQATAQPIAALPAGATASNTPAADIVLQGPEEKDVLLMVMMMGALGGFIHLTSSVTKYIGNREFLRSWVIYYLLMPVEGAGLAVTVYLVVRVGVLNPASSNGTTTPNLNWVGIYALSALAGLFSKQALELLGDVFSTIFKRVEAKDSGATAGPQLPPKP